MKKLTRAWTVIAAGASLVLKVKETIISAKCLYKAIFNPAEIKEKE